VYTAPFVRHAFNYDRDEVSLVSGLATPEPTMAQQQFKEECDINVICERFGLTGELPVAGRMPTYGDFTGVGDFQSAMEAVVLASEAFMALPALVRERFSHDPQRFVEFCSDPANLEEARKLGLAPAAEPPPPSTPSAS
jgi:phage internal scaffolding protein